MVIKPVDRHGEGDLFKHFGLHEKIVMQTNFLPCFSFHQLTFEINYWQLAVFAIDFLASIKVAVDFVFFKSYLCCQKVTFINES